jgi:hypothetical protein
VASKPSNVIIPFTNPAARSTSPWPPCRPNAGRSR